LRSGNHIFVKGQSGKTTRGRVSYGVFRMKLGMLTQMRPLVLKLTVQRWVNSAFCWCAISVVTNALAADPDTSKLPPAAPYRVDFVKEIQPIFAEKCHACHGPKKQEAAFRLDSKDIALKGGELGPAIVPGKSADSLLIHLVAGLFEDKVMPQKGPRLTTEQVSLLRAWIDQGAPWPDSASVKATDNRQHWAFKAPIRPVVPKVKNAHWVRNPIDNFVLAKLESGAASREMALQPSPEADRVTLIRRLSLDLIGLPPTIADVDQFVTDKNPDAYEKHVERLLSSPHYGERWGRHWLDAARYADSNGFEKDAARSIWPYRDWVIDAFNRDLPFDQFTIEQLAGDLLPKPSIEQRIATGFLRNSMLNQEGGIEPEQFRIDAMIDRMDAVGRTWLGLTIACAQCHNHKYDPLSQKEYYQLFAFLNNDDEPFVEVPTPEQQKKRDQILAKVRKLEEKALREATNLTERMAMWEESIADAAGNWTVLEPKEWLNFATKYEKQSDHSLLAGGDVKPGAVTHVWIDTLLTNITGFRIEALMHPNLPYGGPGLVAKGNWLLKEFTAEASALHNPTVTNKITFVRALADLEAPGFSVTNAIDGNTEKGGWTAATVPVRRNTEHRAVFECAEPVVGFAGGTRLKFTVYQKHSSGDGHSGAPDKESGLDCHAFGRFRLSATTQPDPLVADPLTQAQRQLLAISMEQRTDEQRRELFNVFRFHDSAFAEVNRQIDSALTNWPYAATTLALQQRVEPRPTHIFKRGDWQRPGDSVNPDVPKVLHALTQDAPRNRLGFAKWIVDRRSPTTARVLANRIWQVYFGQGLFTTPEDIGTRVEPPSHPELLDWLACEFMEPEMKAESRKPKSERNPKSEDPKLPADANTLRDSGSGPSSEFGVRNSETRPWSVKHLHRLIVNSATYRQSSKVTPELLAKDPYNRLLARGPRFRVEAETVQDIALAASGLLNPKVGGPSVRPAIPTNVADQVYGGFSWPESTGEDRYRRGMYTFWKRSLPFPSMLAFDAPPAEGSCTRRARSNTPLQALTTLNEKTFVEAAQALGLRAYREGGPDDRSRAIYAFRLCTGRPPTETEIKSLLAFWEEQYRYFEDRTADALKVGSISATNPPADANLHKVAAWAMVSRAILNLDETITKE
jgi:mono/diheme cytochrome c family protein